MKIIIAAIVLIVATSVEAVTYSNLGNIKVDDVIANGSLVDVRMFTNLSTAKSNPSTAEKTILVSDAQEINTATVPGDRVLKVVKGGGINVNSGKILRLSGAFEAGNYQVFTGKGDIIFSMGSVLSVNAAWFGVTCNESTDNTAAVQKALNSAVGLAVVIPDGCYFDLSALKFPSNIKRNGYYVLDYRANDDTSSPGHPGVNATNERVRFLQNSNSAGYNNEVHLNSGYSTGLIVNVRRDVDTPNMGAGQDLQYGRVSVAWSQDDLSRIQLKYTDAAGDTTAPGLDDGWTAQFIEPRMTLNNIKASSFTTKLVINHMVRGAKSGARGWVKAIGESSITVTLLSGKFVVGEALILEPAVETTSDTITKVTGPTNKSNSNRIGLSAKHNGQFFSNIQGDDAVHPVNVGGILGIQQSATSIGTYANAEIVMADKLSNAKKQLRIQLESETGDLVIRLGATSTEVLRISSGGGVIANRGITTLSATTKQLNDKTNPINTTNKKKGTMIYNLTSGRPVWSNGEADGDVWKYADGTTAHTPL